MKKVLIVFPELGEGHREKLEKAAAGCDVKYLSGAELSAKDLEEAQIVIGNPSPALLHSPERLEFMQLSSAGADAYVAPGVLRPGTILSCCTGAYSQAVAEHALAATLMLQKKLHLYRDGQSEHKWQDRGTVSSMNGATVLVVGLGDIGTYYATMAKALGAYVIGVKRRLSDKPPCVDELYLTEQFDEIAPRADVIVSFLPGTKATAYFYTPERFKAMKPSAIFVNCGRGNAVSAQVLEEALRSGEIASAALDVFETEPLPPSSTLWGLDNLLITPHASGYFHLPATLDRVVDICSRNLRAYLEGEDIMNQVDFSTGYKK